MVIELCLRRTYGKDPLYGLLLTFGAAMVIEDPKALTKPWNVTKQFRKNKPGLFLYDYGCAENNRNPVDPATGKTHTLGSDGKLIK